MKYKGLPNAVLMAILLYPVAVYGHVPADLEKLRYQRALQDIEGVIVDSGKLDDPQTFISVKSKAASLLWRYDQKRAQALFLDLWKYIDQQKSETFSQDEARTALLKNLFPINAVLATKLLKELTDRQLNEPTLRAQATGNDPKLRRLANISDGLVDQDPSIAARLLEQSLSMGVTPTALSVLSRMRERDPNLANFVISQTLEHLRSRPSIVALTGLHLLTAYVFPSEPYHAVLTETGGSDDRLRYQYFSIGYEILKMSLLETDALLSKEKRYTENDLRFRAIYQGQIALILAALSPRYGPQFVEELTALARRFAGTTPANIAGMSHFIVARLKGESTSSEDPDTAIAIAIANGDFAEARRLIGKIDDEEKKKAFTQLLAKAEFKTFVAEANFTEALNVARRIDNVNLRVLFFLQLARAAYRKDDNSLSKLVLNEARTVLSTPEKDGMRARILLSFASESSSISESDAIDLLHNAVIVINSLSKTNDDVDLSRLSPSELAVAEINDPGSLVDSPDLQRAFSTVARVDFDGTLIAAGRINPIAVQLMARLAASEIALTKRIKKMQVAPDKKTTPKGLSKQAT